MCGCQYAQLRDSADANTIRWSDTDLLRHYQMRDRIIGTAKRRHAHKKKVGQGGRTTICTLSGRLKRMGAR